MSRKVGRTILLAAAASVVMGMSANAAWYTSSYEGDYVPQDPLSNPQWQKYFDGVGTATDGYLTTTTSNTAPGDGPYLEYRLDGGGAWNPTGAGTTVEMRYKVNYMDPAGDGWAGSFILGTGDRFWSAKVGTNFITVVGAGDFYLPSVGIDSSTFHTYRFTTANDTGDLNLYIDGSVTPAHTFAASVGTLSRLAFGDLGTPEGGQMMWDYIRWTNAGVVVPTGPAWSVNASGDWNAAANWGGAAPNAVDAKAYFLDAISSARTVYTDTAVTAGEVKFDNANTYQIAGNGSLSIDVSTGSGSITVVQGTHKINLPLFINDNTTADIAAGATLKISDPMTLVGGSTLTKTGAGTLSIEAPVSNAAPATLALAGGVTNALMDLSNTTTVAVSGGTTNLKATQHLAALNVSGGTVNVGPGSNVVVSTKSLSISGTGKVDLQNSKMVVDYTGASVLASVKSAISAGSLTSSQLTSGRVIGVGEASDLFAGPTGSFAGEIVDSTSVVMAYTINADASLDGVVNSADFNQLVANYGTLANARFTQGDFDGDGKVTTSDFNVLAGNFGQSLPPSASLGAVVPEPTTGLLGAGLVFALRRRRAK